MERLSVWVSAGLLSAGVSAAVLAGAGVAVADDGTSGSSEGSSSNATSGPASQSTTATDPTDSGSPDTGPDTAPDSDAEPDPAPEPEAEAGPEPVAEEPAPGATRPEDSVAEAPKKPKRHLFARSGASPSFKPHSAARTASAPEPAAAVSAPAATESPAVVTPAATDISAAVAPPAGPAASLALAAVPAEAAPVKAAAAPGGSLFRWIAGVTDSIVRAVGGLAINTLQALEALVTGPPALPANSTVTVRNSTILLSSGQRIKANWYYPEGETVPDKMIVLQHGFFALGPMYSYTAANLAEATGAIVVTPTISSNFFARDDAWLNGAGMWNSIADLFTGDRKALTDSALAAGFATRYGLDPATAALPVKFGLAGHSAGGQLVAAVAGYLVDKNAADDLVGVITLDGVPTGTVMADTLRKLQDYQDATGRYIPIREIGAPLERVQLHQQCQAGAERGAAGPVQRGGALRRRAHGLDARRQPDHPVRRLPDRRLPEAAEPAGRRHPVGHLVHRVVRRGHRQRRRAGPGQRPADQHPEGHRERRRHRIGGGARGAVRHPRGLTDQKAPVRIRTGAFMAVAEGFEPSDGGYPSHAFEACSLGRSDTPPARSLPGARGWP